MKRHGAYNLFGKYVPYFSLHIEIFKIISVQQDVRGSLSAFP